MAKIGEIERRITGMNQREVIDYDSHAQNHLRSAEIEKRHERQRRKPIPPALQPQKVSAWKLFTEKIYDIIYKLGPG